MDSVDGKIEAVRVSVAAVGITIWGYTLNDWVAITTIVYMVLQVLLLFPRVYRGIKSSIASFFCRDSK